MSKKIIFIPGWMDTVKNRVDFDGLDIWLEKFDIGKKIDCEYLIGHSTGANWALINWDKNRNTKLVLVMPGIPKRNMASWLYRWIKFIIFERTQFSLKRSMCFFHMFHGIKQLIMVLNADLMPVIEYIPKDKVVFIRGKNDKFFFDKKSAEEIKDKGFRVVEIEGVGHNWHEKISEEIKRIVG